MGSEESCDLAAECTSKKAKKLKSLSQNYGTKTQVSEICFYFSRTSMTSVFYYLME